MSIFDSVPITRPKRSAFNLSNTVYSTTEFGRLCPTSVQECMPADIVKGNHSHKVRFLPMLTPPFGSCFIKSRTFFVPYRLVLPNWEKFITGYYERLRNGQVVFDAQPNTLIDGSTFIPKDLLDYYTSDDSPGHRSMRQYNMLDYIGIQFPNGVTSLPNFEIAKLLAFWKIFFDYFVDENLGHNMLSNPATGSFPQKFNDDGMQEDISRAFNYEDFMSMLVYIKGMSDPITLQSALEKGGLISFVSDNDDNVAVIRNLIHLPNITYKKDYFTSALPWAQKGQPVTIPLFDSATLEVSPVNVRAEMSDVTDPLGSSVIYDQQGSEGTFRATSSSGRPTNIRLSVSGQTVDVANLNPLTINDLRTSFRVQEWLERNARGGSRYIEQIQSHYGVRPQDYRLQRSEYISGTSQPVTFNEVLQTSESNSSPLGTMAGHSVTIGSTRRYKYKCYEHGVLMTISYLTVKPIYFQGIDRRNTRVNFYDYCFPEFAHLGEQAIDNTELYSVAEKGTFGFQSRYAEYKHSRDSLVGGMTSSVFRPWFFGVRNFANNPNLTTEFITVDPAVETDLNAPFPVVEDTTDHVLVESYNDIKMIRPLPKYGVPYM